MTRSAAGLGMTSQRTRARMIERLREQGIRDEAVLAALAAVPRHLFVEEALASDRDVAVVGAALATTEAGSAALTASSSGGELPPAEGEGGATRL